MLEIRGVTKAFGGVKAVDDVSATIGQGSITGLIGPNGAGKTTLFNLIAGSLRPTAGSIRLEGRRIDGRPPHAMPALGLGRTFQLSRPFGAMTVLENVMVAGRGQRGEGIWANWLAPGRVLSEERRLAERAREVLAFVGLDRQRDHLARTLSGGQRKLLDLARILLTEPRLVLLDEPGAGVNPALLAEIMDRIQTLNARGLTFLIIEHNMDLVMGLCRPVLVMAGGRLLMTGTPDEVRADPRVIDAYLGGLAA